MGKQTLSKVEARYQALPLDLRIKVDSMCGAKEGMTDFERRNLLRDAMSVLDCALTCSYACCKDKSREERLAEL